MAISYKSSIGKEDIKWWDGKDTTFTRETSTGGMVTLTKYGHMVDVAHVYGNGSINADILASAIAAIGSNKVTLLITPGTWTIGSNLTIPSNCALYMPQGAIFNISSGVTLTINSSFQAGLYQVFSGDGNVSFGTKRNDATYVVGYQKFTSGGEGNIIEVIPIWWGNNTIPGTTDMSNAFIKAAESIKYSGGKINVPYGFYKINNKIPLYGYVEWDFNYSVIWTNTTDYVFFGDSTDYQYAGITGSKIHNVYVWNKGTTDNVYFIYIHNAFIQCYFSNIRTYGLGAFKCYLESEIMATCNVFKNITTSTGWTTQTVHYCILIQGDGTSGGSAIDSTEFNTILSSANTATIAFINATCVTSNFEMIYKYTPDGQISELSGTFIHANILAKRTSSSYSYGGMDTCTINGALTEFHKSDVATIIANYVKSCNFFGLRWGTSPSHDYTCAFFYAQEYVSNNQIQVYENNRLIYHGHYAVYYEDKTCKDNLLIIDRKFGKEELKDCYYDNGVRNRISWSNIYLPFTIQNPWHFTHTGTTSETSFISFTFKETTFEQITTNPDGKFSGGVGFEITFYLYSYTSESDKTIKFYTNSSLQYTLTLSSPDKALVRWIIYSRPTSAPNVIIENFLVVDKTSGQVIAQWSDVFNPSNNYNIQVTATLMNDSHHLLCSYPLCEFKI